MAATATITTSAPKAKPKQKQKEQRKPKMTKDERRLKYTNIARERRQKQNHKTRHSNTVCFLCRKRGHTVSECPNNNNSNVNGDNDNQQNKKYSSSNICFKCGETSHSLKACPKLTKEEVAMQQQNRRWNYHNMDLPFATCFICKQTGHLSSQCTQNTNGIYINGSGCKFCGKNDHLFMYCPEKNKKCRIINKDSDDESAGNVDEFLEEESGTKDANDSGSSNTDATITTKKKKKKVVKF